MFAHVLSAILAAVLPTQAGSPQAAPATVVDRQGLRMHAVARRVAAPDSAETTLQWVAEPFPVAADVLVTDPIVKAAVIAALTRLASGVQECRVWLWESSNECDLGGRLARAPELSAFSFRIGDPVELLDPPEMEGLERSPTASATYVPPGQRDHIRSLIVSATTEHVKPGAPAHTLTLSAAAAAARIGASPPSPAINDVPITVALADADRIRRGGEPFAVERLQNELLRVALNVITLASDLGLVPGGTASPATLGNIDDAIRAVYSIDGLSWPGKPRTRRPDNGGDFSLEMTALRFVSRLAVDVRPAIVERENGRFTFVGATPAGEAKLVARREAAAERARALLTRRGDQLEGTIPTNARIIAAIEDLRTQRDITLTDRPAADVDGTIVFPAAYHGSESELSAKADLQASFDPEQFIVGSGTLHAHNILDSLFHRDIREDIDLTATGGPEVQNIALDVSVSRERGLQHIIRYGFMSRTFLTRDANQRLGNLPAFGGEKDSDVPLVDREWCEVPKLFAQYEWAGGWRRCLRWEGALDWRRVLVSPRLRTLPPRVDGRLTAWDNSFEYRLAHSFPPAARPDEPLAETAAGAPAEKNTRPAPDPGVGAVALDAAAVIRRATRQLAGDFDFSRTEVSVTGEIVLGWQTRSDVFLRQRTIAAGASAGTPLFQLHRLGGPANVRGLEEGEYIGRRLRAQQYTAGLGLPMFWPALRGTSAPPALANAYLTAFYDRGSTRLDAGGIAANGYGVGIEIRNLPAGSQRAHIAIGWARSPQSALHRRGVMTVGVHFGLGEDVKYGRRSRDHQ